MAYEYWSAVNRLCIARTFAILGSDAGVDLCLVPKSALRK
jgi:hypothetical protein